MGIVGESPYQAAVNKIDAKATYLEEVSHKIWKHPEVKFEERFAHDTLCAAFEESGFKVTRNYILPTGFRAEFTGSGGATPTVAVICEYDALPDIGHACGHNLIAEAGLATALGIKSGLEADPLISGKIVVFGTPAEEGGNGKVFMINGGAFKQVDAALMVHPSPSSHLYPPFIGVLRGTARYKGKSAHASGYPWEGVNSLDAAVSAYTSLALLRQHIKPTSRINVVITKGGKVANIIPEESELAFYVRAANSKEMDSLSAKVKKCFESAAESTGCKLDYKLRDNNGPNHLITNRSLAETYRSHAESLGVKFSDGDPKVIPFMASTDFGSVSHVIPSIHPTFSIGTTAPNHSSEFTKVSGSKAAQPPTIAAAKSMALTALDLFTKPSLLEEVREQFKLDKIADKE